MGVWYCRLRCPPVLFLASNSCSSKSHALSAGPKDVLVTLAHLPVEADTCSWVHDHAVCHKLFAFQQRSHRNDSSGGCQSFGGWMLFGECSKITGHPALCTPTDCHTSKQRLPGWKGWASLVATEGEFLLPALLLVMHSPCFPTPGTPRPLCQLIQLTTVGR